MFPLSMLKLLLPEQLIQRLIQGLTDSKAEAEGWIVFPCLGSGQWSGVSPRWHPAGSPGSYHARPGPF